MIRTDHPRPGHTVTLRSREWHMREARRGSHWEGPSWGQFEQVDDLDSCSRLRVAVESKRLFFVPVFLSPEAVETLDSLAQCTVGWKPMFFSAGLY